VNKMNLNHLQKFVTTVKAGSITAAAMRMAMPKSSLSRQLSELEQDLGITLLERRPRHFETTEAGGQLFSEVEPLLLGILEARENLEKLKTSPRGPLQIQVPTEFLGEDISDLCLGFVSLYPEIQLSVTEYTGLIPRHPEGKDISFVFHDAPLPDMDVVAMTLASFPQSIYSSPKLSTTRATTRSSKLRIEDIEKKKLVIHSKEVFWHFRSKSNQRTSIKTQAAIIMDSHTMRLQACLGGHGLARFMDYRVASLVRDGKLVKLQLAETMMALSLSVLYRHRRIPKKVQAFVDYVQSHMVREGSRPLPRG